MAGLVCFNALPDGLLLLFPKKQNYRSRLNVDKKTKRNYTFLRFVFMMDRKSKNFCFFSVGNGSSLCLHDEYTFHEKMACFVWRPSNVLLWLQNSACCFVEIYEISFINLICLLFFFLVGWIGLGRKHILRGDKRELKGNLQPFWQWWWPICLEKMNENLFIPNWWFFFSFWRAKNLQKTKKRKRFCINVTCLMVVIWVK